MSKKQKAAITATEPSTALVVLEPVVTPEQEAADDAEIAEQIAKPRSVVQRKYKVRYRDRARANGQRTKAAKRSAWDWLAQQLAKETLTKDAKLRVDDFLAILTANGVAYEHWLTDEETGEDKRTKGWEGRLRMTGRLALQRVVAETGILHFANGDYEEAPAEWVAQYLR